MKDPKKLPAPVKSTAAEALGTRYTHSRLDTLFGEADAPGEPPTGNKNDKARELLTRAEDAGSAFEVLGSVLADFFEEDSAVTLRDGADRAA